MAEEGMPTESKPNLEAELSLIARRGYADESDEFEVGTSAVAAPIIDHTGAVVAALVISGPSSRFDIGSRRSAVPALISAANAIAADLGVHRSADLVDSSI